jgi:hypothetical protein
MIAQRLVVLAALVFAGTAFSTGYGPKTLRLTHTATPIVIDGQIDAAWAAADSITDFEQHAPFHGRKPSHRMIAKVLTNESRLYSLIICYDDRHNIQASTGKLDEFTGDVVSIMLDTFGDERTAYKFAVSASGVRMDARLLDDARDRDYTWDGVWFAATSLYDWGFVVEIEIPYKSIQYAKNLSAWGLDFDWWNPKRSEDVYWCAYEQNEGQRISKFGRLAFEHFYPSTSGLHLEVYPVGIAKATYVRERTYKVEPDAGIDLFYNPSERLTFQLTGNPDFAQIEADPFAFNISRYETYYDERRPFFTEGKEIFTPSGRQRSTGFYRPLELFYSRRIGKKLPDGSEVPLTLGSKTFGRSNEWEYGGFVALTGAKDYSIDGVQLREPDARFGSIRLKRQLLGNSSLGLLFVGKSTDGQSNSVLDIDGAFRTSSWQLAYQLARSFTNGTGGYASSAGFTMFAEHWLALVRGRYITDNFDVSQVGFVPWHGTGEFVGLFGPRWYFEGGTLREMLLYIGPTLNYEKIDGYTDHGVAFGFNQQFRSNWRYEINSNYSKAKDQNRIFNSYELTLSTWFNVSPSWSANVWGGYSRTYNFARDYLAFYSWAGASASWRPADVLHVGTSYDMFIEGNPDGGTQDITYNARPFISLTPVNDLNVRVYVDNVFVRSTNRMERIIGGFLFAYNFSPKSWLYIALNEVRDRSRSYDAVGNLQSGRMHVTDRAGVVKVKYLYFL